MFIVSEAVGELGVCEGNKSFSLRGRADGCFICITVEPELVLTEDLSKWEDVNDEEQGTKYRALGDAVGDLNVGGFAVVDGN